MKRINCKGVGDNDGFFEIGGERPDDDLFKTYKITFKDRSGFDKATDMNNLADDIGHSDMVMVYSDVYHRNRFAGYLAIQGILIELT